MANKFLVVAVLALLTTYAAGASVPSPSFRFSYTGPEEGTISQSYDGPSDQFQYKWGYQFPGQEHSEKKTYDGQVKGDYAFTDANGDVQQVRYQAAPDVGFTEERAVAARSGAVAGVFPAQATFEGFSGQTDELDLAYQASPQLQASVRAGQLVPFQQEGQLVFRVRDSLVDDAQGSVSALATQLGVDLVAARHDQQIPSNPATLYSGQPDSTNRGVLETSVQPDGTTIYVVRIPETF